MQTGFSRGWFLPAFLAAMIANVWCGEALSAGDSEPTPVRLEGPARAWDGDTLEVAGYRVRLNGVDAPEMRGDARGPVARAEMDDILMGREVVCDISGKNRDRLVGRCYLNGDDVGEALIRAGWAFEHRKYTDDYAVAEAEARAAGRGFWAGGTNPLSLWEIIGGAGTLLSALTALAVAGLTAMTVREMRRGREETARPYLVMNPSPKTYKTVIESMGSTVFVWFMPPGKKYEADGVWMASEGRPKFEVQNVGTGMARSIKITWNYGGPALGELISDSPIFDLLSPKVTGDAVEFREPSDDADRLQRPEPGESWIHYCLPVADKENPLLAEMPNNIAQHLGLVMLALEFSATKPKPKIWVDVNAAYETVAGEKLEQRMQISCSQTYFSTRAKNAPHRAEDVDDLYSVGELGAETALNFFVRVKPGHLPPGGKWTPRWLRRASGRKK